MKTEKKIYSEGRGIHSEQFDSVFPEVKERITQDVLRLSQGGYLKNQKGVIRLETPCLHIDCLDWLYTQVDSVKVYWASRDNSFQMAGIGIADVVQGATLDTCAAPFAAIAQRFSVDTDIRYYGGMAFFPPEMNTEIAHKRKTAQEWNEFGAYYFVLPRFEIVRRWEKYFFACNIAAQNVSEPLLKEYARALDEISFSLSSLPISIPKLKSISLFPQNEEWRKLFKGHIQPRGKMAYQKIVLAQKTSIELASKVNPLEVFKKLIQQAQGSFHYYFQPRENCAFFGASPERLFKRQGADIESEALAGTRPRGKTTIEDAHFEKILRDSAKDALEHEIVVEAVKGAFKKLCASWEADTKASVAKVSGAHHLMTCFRGTLKDNVDDARILTVLHPTPAVGGIPRAEAFKAIAKLEPFERGWYAGPIGYVGCDCVDFAVALRCALMRDSYVNLYAGAGIVEGSRADEEWQEIEQKKSIFLNLFKER